jgi:hypothetical protein
MRKPMAFNWLDLLSFGGLALLMVIGAVAVTALAGNGAITVDGGSVWNAVVLVWVVALVSVGIYVRLILVRRSTLREYQWITHPDFVCGFMVYSKGYDLKISEFQSEVKKTAEGWIREVNFPSWEALGKGPIWVRFEPWPVNNRGVKVAGFSVANSRSMVVGFRDKDQPLENTAFAHELGHIIQGYATGVWNQAEHHQRSKDHGLP